MPRPGSSHSLTNIFFCHKEPEGRRHPRMHCAAFDVGLLHRSSTKANLRQRGLFKGCAAAACVAAAAEVRACLAFANLCVCVCACEENTISCLVSRPILFLHRLTTNTQVMHASIPQHVFTVSHHFLATADDPSGHPLFALNLMYK